MVRPILVLLVAVWAGGAAEAQKGGPKARPPAPAAWPIEEIRIEGLHDYTRDKVLVALNLKVGQMAAAKDFQAARDRLLATGALATVLGAVAFAAVLFAGVLFAGVLGATFEAVAFEPVAFAAVFAVLFGIELLLFFEDLAAGALAAFWEARARLLDAPRLTTAAAFLEAFEVLFLRVFCDTACARNCHAPVRCFHGNP